MGPPERRSKAARLNRSRATCSNVSSAAGASSSSVDFLILRLLRIRGVEPAFLLAAAGPTSRPFVLARLHGARAVRATDAGIAAIVELIVRERVLHDVAPDFFLGPLHDRAQLE